MNTNDEQAKYEATMKQELNPYPGNLKQHTVLNAEEIAAKRFPRGFHMPMWTPEDGYAAAIREREQPLADELEQVKAERDELREMATELLAWNERNPMGHGSIEGDRELEVVLDKAHTILAKYTKP